MQNRLSSDDLKRRVRESNDIVQVIESAVGKLTRAGRNWKACCPFHHEKSPSFNINPEGQYFKCFGCGKGGDVFTFVMLHERCEFPEALRILADRAGIPVEYDPETIKTQRKETDWRGYLYKLNAAAAAFFQEQLQSPGGKAAREYIQRRGLSDAVVNRFGLGYAPAGGSPLVARLQMQRAPAKAVLAAGLATQRDDGAIRDFFFDRLMFPIRDIQGRVIAFGGRVLGDGEPKYLNTRDTLLFSKTRTVYAIDLAKTPITESRTAVIVEGYTDVMMCHQHGLQNVVACLGTAITAEHVRHLRRVADQLVLLTDSDAAGARASERGLAVLLQEQMPARIARLSGGDKDPCDFLRAHPLDGVSQFNFALEQGIDLLDYKFECVRKKHNIASATGLQEAARELMELISTVPDALLRSRYRDEIRARLSLTDKWNDVSIHDLKFTPQRAPQVASVAEEPARPGHVPDVGTVSVPEDDLARCERELLRFLFHEPAWMETALSEVDLATLSGALERLVGLALLDGMAEGLLPPDLTSLENGQPGAVVARHVLTFLQDGQGRDAADLPTREGAKQVAIDLAERAPATTKLEPGMRLDMVIRPLKLARLKRRHDELARAWSAEQAEFGPGSTEAQKSYEALVAVRRELAEVKKGRSSL